MRGAHRPPPVDLRPVHRPRRSRDRLRRLSGHTGTDRVLGAGTGGLGQGTDGRVRTGQAEPVVVTAGRRGQETGQLLIERAVPEAASRLRHGVATYLVDHGRLLEAQARLGHRDPATTLRHYCHATPLDDTDVADELDRLLNDLAQSTDHSK